MTAPADIEDAIAALARELAEVAKALEKIETVRQFITSAAAAK